MPFGLSNAVAVLQRVVEEVLGDLLGKVCFAQLDEIIVCSKSFADHEKDLREVLSKFRIAGLKIEFNNCNWVREEVKYLGHSVSKEGIKTLLDQHKLNVCFVKNEDFTAEERLEVLGRIEERFTDIGASSLMDLGKTCLIEHEVNTGTAKPIKQSMRRVPFAMKAEFNKLIDEMLNAGLIVESESPWCSPTVLVKKKDGSMRICIDYRRVNEVTVKDSYPIPKIEEILNQLGGNCVFTTLDLASGYHQVLVKKEDRCKTAFCTDRGLFEYVVMPFGLTNAPATFQRLMERVLKGLIGKICLVYLDDLMIYSKSLHEHEEHLALVLTRIKEAGLKRQFF